MEDNLLTELVARFGACNWEYISQHIHGRNAKSCRLRWLNHLNPAVNKTPFTAVENVRLLQLQTDFGNKWSTIAHFFPGRTDNQLKNQYHLLVKSKSFESSAQYAPLSDDHGSLESGSVNGVHFLSFTGTCEGAQTMPKASNNSSSVYARDETCCAVSQGATRPRDSVMSDANSRVVLELFPMSKPEEGIRRGINVEVIDFMGIGSSK